MFVGPVLGVELGADGKPIHHLALDRFDHPVGTTSGDAETGSDFIDGHVVAAADPDFAIAIDAADQRIADHIKGMSVVGILGILKAGGGYVPLDAEYPAQRLKFMVEDAGIAGTLECGDLSPLSFSSVPSGPP